MTFLPLIATDSPLYRKRLVRELNSQNGNGFWMKAPGLAMRCVCARLRKGAIEVRTSMQSVSPRGGGYNYRIRWISVASGATFEDVGRGDTISASRHAARKPVTA